MLVPLVGGTMPVHEDSFNFYLSQTLPMHDNSFNFYLGQLHISIEMAFTHFLGKIGCSLEAPSSFFEEPAQATFVSCQNTQFLHLEKRKSHQQCTLTYAPCYS
jgi:hypothetical protein